MKNVFARCNRCQLITTKLELFSKGECLKCHEKAEAAQPITAPDFLGTINGRTPKVVIKRYA